MKSRKIQWDIDAWEDSLYWQKQDRKTLKRVNLIIQDICRNPFNGIEKPEQLKGSLAGFWSRRINDTDRIVYAVEEDDIFIISCKGHYK